MKGLAIPAQRRLTRLHTTSRTMRSISRCNWSLYLILTKLTKIANLTIQLEMDNQNTGPLTPSPLSLISRFRGLSSRKRCLEEKSVSGGASPTYMLYAGPITWKCDRLWFTSSLHSFMFDLGMCYRGEWTYFTVSYEINSLNFKMNDLTYDSITSKAGSFLSPSLKNWLFNLLQVIISRQKTCTITPTVTVDHPAAAPNTILSFLQGSNMSKQEVH